MRSIILLLAVALLLPSCVTVYHVESPETKSTFVALGNAEFSRADPEGGSAFAVDSDPGLIGKALVDLAELILVPLL